VRTFRLFFLSLLFVTVVPPATAETMVPLAVRAGSSLARLANLYCRDREDWRRVAEVNKLPAPYVIYEDTTLLVPAELLLKENVNATVGAVHGAARLSLAASSPQPVVVGDNVPPGATIETGGDGYVLLVFPDQRFIQLNASSRLRVDFAFRLADGSVRVETTLEQGESLNDAPHSRPNDGSTSRTPTTLIGVRGTAYRLKVNGAENTWVETLRGEVSATAQGVSRIVPLDQGVVVHKKGAPSPPRPLPPSPNGLVMEKVYKSQPVHFQLPANPSGGPLHLIISRDERSLQVITERGGKANESLAVTLPEDGLYFLSLTADDKAGFESLPTPAKAFLLRTSPGAPIMSIPKDARFFTSSAPLSWTQPKEAAVYHVMVARDPGFAKPLSEATVAAAVWNTPKLPLGQYYARIQSIAADGFQSAWSEPAAFTIAESPQLLNNELTTGGPILLRWNAAKEGDTYDLQVSEQPDFTETIVTAQGLQHPEYTLESPLKPGVYYLRIRNDTMSVSGTESPWGPTQQITIHPAPMTLADKLILGVLFLCIFP
jgi:hypothetical protein